MPIRELIKEYRGCIWMEAYCHPVGDSDESDSVLEKIESELKELEEKAEAFDWLAERSGVKVTFDNLSGIHELILEAAVFCDETLLECVRKARGEE